MRSDVVDGVSGLGVSVENASNQVLALARDELWHGIICTHDLLVEVRSLRVFEWKVPTNHGVENHTTAPNIRLESVVPLPSDHLRGCITRRSTSCFKSSSCFIHVG